MLKNTGYRAPTSQLHQYSKDDHRLTVFCDRLSQKHRVRSLINNNTFFDKWLQEQNLNHGIYFFKDF